MKLLGIAAACVFFLTYCPAAEQVIELGKVQIANSLSGRVIGPAGEQIPDVQVIEVTADWRTAVRRTLTDAQGRWALAPVAGQRIYYIRLVKSGFNEVRFRVQLDKRKGKELLVKMPIA